MPYRQVLVVATAALCCIGAGSAGTHTDSPTNAPARPQPGAFSYLEVNRGQSDPGVDFLARCGSYMAWIRPCDVVLALSAPAPAGPASRVLPRPEPEAPAVVDLRLVGATPQPARAGEVLPGASNYMIGRNESKWVIGAPHVRTARYEGSWPGVSVVWSMDRRRLHVEFEVAPGAAPDPVALAFDGATRIGVDRDGSLRISATHGDAVFSPPVAFQPGGRRVDVRWRVRGDGVADFEFGAWDRSRTLTIDPSLTYSTYLGGTSNEYPGGVAVDSSGNVYMGGYSQSSNLPVTSGAYQSSNLGFEDAYCIKLNASGSTLGYCTYVGGSSADYGVGIGVNSSGNAFIGGYTLSSSDFPTTSGAAVTNFPNLNNSAGFVVKLNASGSALSYSTFVANGISQCMTVDASGAAYLAMHLTRVSVYKLNAAGTSIAYSTNYGVNNAPIEEPMGIAVDASGNAYVVGYTQESSFPTTTGAFSTTYGGGSDDAFVFKLNSSGNVAWSTLLGGSGEDKALGVTIDGSGYPWVVGHTSSSNFPTVNAYSTGLGAGVEAFVTKIDTGGGSLAYSTYLGGGYGTAVAAQGAFVYVGGQTSSSTFPTLSPYQSELAGLDDAFVTVIRCDAALESSTYLGGSGYDSVAPQGLAVDSSGTLCAYCYVRSGDFPTQNAYDTSLGGTQDAGLAKLTGLVTPFVVNANTLPAWTQGIAFQQSLTTTGAAGSVTWSVSAGSPPPGVALSASGVLSGTPTSAGTYNFTVRGVDSCQQTATRPVSFLVNPPPTISAVPAQSWTRTRPYQLTMTAANGTAPLTFSVASGTVPPGLNLGGDGVLAGTPTETGSYSFDAKVTDLRGATASTPVAVHIAEVPSINATTMPDCTERVPFTKGFTATDGTQPLVWSVSAGTFPLNKTIAADTGLADGTTIAKGTYTFTLRVTDAAGAFGERELTMKVNPSPKIDTASLPLAVTGRPYAATLAGHAGTPPLKWRPRSFLPTGVGIDQDTGALSGVPTLADGGAIRFGYDDACGGVDERVLRLDVATPFDLTRHKAKVAAVFDEQLRNDPQYFAVEMIEGTSLSVVVKAKAKGDLPVDVALLDPSGNEIDTSGAGGLSGSSFKLAGFAVPATGRYFLRLAPLAPFADTVTATVKIAAASTFGGTVHLDPSQPPVDLRIPVLAGAKLSITVKAAKGSGATPEIVSVTQDGAELLVPGQVKGSGETRKLKLPVPLAEGEAHVFLGAGTGEPADVTWTLKLKQPKTYTFSMAGVPAGD